MNYKKNKVLMAVMVYDNDGLLAHLKAGANPNMVGPNGTTPLHMATILCNDTAVKILVENGANLETFDKNGMTPLAYAVLPALETPLPHLRRALKTEDGRAALDEARELARNVLVEAGADWNAKSPERPKSLTPLERFQNCYPEKAEALFPQVGPVDLDVKV